jgi:hypothetical protein
MVQISNSNLISTNWASNSTSVEVIGPAIGVVEMLTSREEEWLIVDEVNSTNGTKLFVSFGMWVRGKFDFISSVKWMSVCAVLGNSFFFLFCSEN